MFDGQTKLKGQMLAFIISAFKGVLIVVQVFPKDDSRVLQVSLRRLEEEEWFGSSKIVS